MEFYKHIVTNDDIQKVCAAHLKMRGTEFLTETREREYCLKAWRGMVWLKSRRPFLNVYPKVIECLKNTSLKIDPGVIEKSIVNELGSIEIRTPKSGRIPPFFLSVSDNWDHTLRSISDGMVGHESEFDGGIRVEFCMSANDPSYYGDKAGIGGRAIPFGKEIDISKVDFLSADAGFSDELEDRDACIAMMDDITRIAIGVMLLASDPRFIEPILLNRDLKRSLTDEQKKAAVNRARKRGLVGFDLGKNIEISPHFRRPHFAIRWTGKGGAVPRLVPVKGAIINKEILGNIPTGYDGCE